MNRVLEIDYETAPRASRPASPISASPRPSAPKGFFYAPDPSSQLACTLAGNIAMNSGGAHCLKYGVTTNNVLGVKMVLMDGEIVEIGGAHLDAAGYDLLGLIVGSEGQFGIVTEATVRILRRRKARGRCCSASIRARPRDGASRGIIASGIIPVAIEFMDKPAIEVCEASPRPAIRWTSRRC